MSHGLAATPQREGRGANDEHPARTGLWDVARGSEREVRPNVGIAGQPLRVKCGGTGWIGQADGRAAVIYRGIEERQARCHADAAGTVIHLIGASRFVLDADEPTAGRKDVAACEVHPGEAGAVWGRPCIHGAGELQIAGEVVNADGVTVGEAGTTDPHPHGGDVNRTASGELETCKVVVAVTG